MQQVLAASIDNVHNTPATHGAASSARSRPRRAHGPASLAQGGRCELASGVPGPLPVANFRHILSMSVDVMPVFDEFVLQVLM
jgi:hypothetical protein